MYMGATLITADNVDSYTSFLEGDQLPFDWTKMSRVMHPDDWDPQNHVWPVDAAELWAASPKPDGYELPQAYADAVADGCIDKLKAEYELPLQGSDSRVRPFEHGCLNCSQPCLFIQQIWERYDGA